MKKEIPYRPKQARKVPLHRTDPRLVALVKFLARRAAERDYSELLAEQERDNKKKNKKEGEI